MRRHITFDCAGSLCAATLDAADGTTGLLIVSGGNEIRCGAHAGQAAMAAHFAAMGHPVFRYDRRGIGESEGENGGFESSADDIAAALSAFREAAQQLERIVAFGNCDAASALMLFQSSLPLDGLILANPWVVETADTQEESDAPTTPSAAAIRARYWERIKNPRSIVDLFTGKINLKKLAGGLAKASQKEAPTGLAARMAQSMSASILPARILVARRDNTALSFMSAWSDDIFAPVRERANVTVEQVESASHSFADAEARAWLYGQIGTMLSD